MSEQQQYYDGMGWTRPVLEGEVEERFPGEYHVKGMADGTLRTLLIADDQGKREVFDNSVAGKMNKLGRKLHDLGEALKDELRRASDSINNFYKALENHKDKWQ